MTEHDISSLTLTEVAQEIAARRLSSQEVTEASMDRLAGLGATLDCVAAVDREAAVAAARAADSELAKGKAVGALHGVPLAHKDMFYRAGRVSACGSRILADHTPTVTATALQRLDSAGALDVARLNMVEFASGPTGHNPIAGTPRNPWNPEHVTGGSSSGPVAAVAARLVYGSLGSDTGGSVRMPAACCGLVGMKPTYGLVSRFGAMPLSHTLDHVGPIARTVGDCALLLREIAGHDVNDATTSRRAVPDYVAELENGIQGLRIAVPSNYFYDTLDPEIAELMQQSLDVYQRLGARLVSVEIPSIEIANTMVNIILSVEAATIHAEWLRTRLDDYGPATAERLLHGLVYRATTYLQATTLAHKVLSDFSRAVFDCADLLHVPTLTLPVPTIEQTDPVRSDNYMNYVLSFGHCTRAFNYLRLPALNVPAGFTASGLPTGFQLVGRPFDEGLLFRAARAYEREVRWTDMSPTAGIK